jgi:hypothetical protein
MASKGERRASEWQTWPYHESADLCHCSIRYTCKFFLFYLVDRTEAHDARPHCAAAIRGESTCDHHQRHLAPAHVKFGNPSAA